MHELLDLKLEETFLVHGLAIRTRVVYAGCARRFISWAGSDPRGLRRSDIERFLVHLVRDRGISAATHAQYVAALRFLYGRALGLPEVTRDLPRPRIETAIPEILAPEQVARVLAAASSSMAKTALALGYFTGLRVGEVSHLSVAAVDRARRVVVVRNSKGHTSRVVAVPERALNIVDEYVHHTSPAGPWLFPGRRRGEPVSDRTLNRYLQVALDRSGVTAARVTFHSLRHSYATHLLDEGVSIRVIQALLGHRRLDTTARYAHVSTRQLEAACRMLDSLLS